MHAPGHPGAPSYQALSHPGAGAAPAAGGVSVWDVVQGLAATLNLTRATLEQVAALVRETREGPKRRPGVVPQYIEDIPGKRVPYTAVVTVLFDEAITNNQRKSNTFTVSEDGPFVITAYRAFWQVTTQSSGADADVHRAFLPPSRLPFLIRAATAVPVVDRDVIDFILQLQVAGGDRLWQNSDVPAVKFYDAVSPAYLGVPGFMERNETMTVSAAAQVSGTAANAPDSSARGTFWFVMDGYKILRPIDYAEAQGWSPG